jgi:CelD/BcsL family acetyltransferase involved in cellulose biosynthesis
MDVYSFDPLRDSRWPEFVGRHPNASVFHTSAWLRALELTYHFAPIAFTTSPPTAELKNALVFSAIRSWLTGRRLVSLPFSDHCQPLVDDRDELRALCASVLRHRAAGRWKYVEMRPANPVPSVEESLLETGFRTTQTFYLHRLDLRPDLDALLHSFHKDSIQRKIRRAEREHLVYEEGRSEGLLRKLCHLLNVTRRRHLVPLQPLAWFRNLVEGFGEQLSIRIASKDGEPAAGILTLVHGDTVVYKYGGSETRLNPLGGMPLLFWKTIEDAKQTGARTLDLGRSDLGGTGLIRFKEHLAATSSTLTYWRSPGETRSISDDGWKMRLARRAFAGLPGGIRRAAGSFLYRHIG